MTELLLSPYNHFDEVPKSDRLNFLNKQEVRSRENPDLAVVVLWEGQTDIERFKRDQNEQFTQYPWLQRQFYDEVPQPHATIERFGLLKDLTPEQVEALPYELRRLVRGFRMAGVVMGEEVCVGDGIINSITSPDNPNPLQPLHEISVEALNKVGVPAVVNDEFHSHTTGRYAKELNESDKPQIERVASSVRPGRGVVKNIVLTLEWPVRDDDTNTGFYAFEAIESITLDD